MKDADCTAFLQWALPRLGFRWPGFRRVRRQVCRRIRRRLAELDLPDFYAYRVYLEGYPAEATVLDGFCRITISRFFRDRWTFERLRWNMLPMMARSARDSSEPRLRIWCAGCASGEEPYTLAINWRLEIASRFPKVSLSIFASDTDPHMLARARRGVYTAGSVRELPERWRQEAFRQQGEVFTLRDDFRRDVNFFAQDIRDAMPDGTFDLVFCRYLAFTYFDEPLQRDVLGRLATRLRPGGVLAIGSHETLPTGVVDIVPAGPLLYHVAPASPG